MSGSSGGVINNVRLVKCPKCNRVLPELVDVPVYRCGGCGVVLQAKNRKKKIEETRCVPSEAPLVPATTEMGNAQDSKESCSPHQNEEDISPEGDKREQSNDFQKSNSPNCVTEVERGNVSNEFSVDNEVLASEDGNFGENEQQESACHVEGPSKDELPNVEARKLFVGTDPTSVSSTTVKETSNGLDHHTVDNPSYLSGSDSEKEPFSRENILPVECQPEEELQHSQEKIYHENGASYENAGVEADELLIKRKRKPIVATGNTHLANASLPADGVCSGPEPVNEIASTFSSPVSEELHSFGAKSSSPNEDDFAYGSSYSDVIQTLPIKKAEHSQTSSPSVYDCVSGTHEPEGTAIVVPISSELGGTFGKIPKSASTRGYAYDGSISSYEDQYDQIYKETFRDVNYPENVGKRNFNSNQVSNITAMQQQAQEFFSEKNHKTTQESSWSPRESDELMRHQIRNQMGFEAENYPSGVPFTNRAYENDGFSSDCWDGIRSDSSIYAADKLPYTEKKRVELLKMVHKLQEELSRSPAGNRNVDRRNISQFENIMQFSNERQMPQHPRRREFMDENDLRSSYSRYPYARSEQGTHWPRQQNNSWVPFSGEVRNRRHHDEHYCQHRQPMNQHFSAQLASSACSICSLNNRGLQRVHLHSGDQFHNPYSSSTSSPGRPTDMDFPFPSRVPDVNYNDQGLMDRYVEASLANSSIATDHLRSHEIKTIHEREHQLRVKRHIRPTVGGAPFITCYQCWSMLQVPADAFLFKRRFHKLKCGSCSTILRFSIEDGTHVVPYYRAPPPGEIKCKSPVINHTSNVSINSRSNGIQMSQSDHGFGNSFGRSFSTTKENQESHAAPSRTTQAHDAGGKKTSSGGYSDISEGKKKRLSKPFFSKDKRPVEIPETSSANRTFNIENYSIESKTSKPRTGSPLHKLMGYTSISQVFRGPSKGTSESFRNKSTR